MSDSNLLIVSTETLSKLLKEAKETGKSLDELTENYESIPLDLEDDMYEQLVEYLIKPLPVDPKDGQKYIGYIPWEELEKTIRESNKKADE